MNFDWLEILSVTRCLVDEHFDILLEAFRDRLSIISHEQSFYVHVHFNLFLALKRIPTNLIFLECQYLKKKKINNDNLLQSFWKCFFITLCERNSQAL
jgi:hypothetical protein